MEKLPPLLNSTSMLTCAEDLGMIPACVPKVMNELKILSLEIERMPKDYGIQFGELKKYPYLSVCTTSTHDMSGIRGWWESNREIIQNYYNNVLKRKGEAPPVADPKICEEIIINHLGSSSMFCILPIQDWLSCDGLLRRENPHEEQINDPSNSGHYWRYRLHISMEDLIDNENFNMSIRNKILESNR